MKSLTRENAEEYAKKLMFNIQENEVDQLVKDFQVMAQQLRCLEKLPGIESVEPMTFPFENEDVRMREDEVTVELSREEAFSNCKDVKDGEVRVPRVVGE
ncbi:Asp-tRNA(Asn)/Glu-tRNA(Gln) amidotransferase subunit GatC [Candidatus Saccharibacteria bacterium]|nr:Asp-tRNA(Asn)/Glu-tRNA(Gln) amidotransferase subunit GatC [Candidatus Saccharibacteria bacterium]